MLFRSKVEGRITAEIEATTPSVTEDSYTVVLGDSLWKIASAKYGDGMEWTKIYNANKDKINDSDILYVGQVLVLP